MPVSMNFSWLNLQYPFEETFEEKRNTILILSASAGLVLILLQPFGFSITDQSFQFLAVIVIGAITMGVNFIVLPTLFPTLFKDSHWSIVKALIFLSYNFLIIGFWYHLYQVVFVEENIFLMASPEQLVSGISKVVAIGLVASGFLVLIRYNILTRRHLQIAQELNDWSREIVEQPHKLGNSSAVRLALEGKEILLNSDDLLWISAEGNYISLKVRGQSKNLLYRATMKQMEAALVEFPAFFRCHRSFVINLKAISSLKGNSQGLFVHIDKQPEKIPVARPKIKWLKSALNEYASCQFVTN
ncbi:MAG: LytTR family DNA-binding domain-containing protein [Cytophagales bacterium]|nr:LytTR family DNA-binding domain-containing protein [Cytophagales bacterium]